MNMYGNEPLSGSAKEYFLPSTNTYCQNVLPNANLTNKYVYVQQNFLNSNPVSKAAIPKVLVNPNFNKKVFVNPNFNVNNVLQSTSVPKIHVNPNAQKLRSSNSEECTSINKIHINPNILRNIPISSSNKLKSENCSGEIKHRKPTKDNRHLNTLVFAKNKLINSPMKFVATENKPRKCRPSVESKFKIIRSSILNSSIENANKTKRLSVQSKYKIVKSSNHTQNYVKNSRPLVNKFKLDNRKNNMLQTPLSRNKKYVYVNRFLSISDIAKNTLLKPNAKKNCINISGVLYKKTPNSLRRTSDPSKKINKTKNQQNIVCKSQYRYIIKSLNNKTVGSNSEKLLKQCKLIRTSKAKKNVSPGKLHKCNIPCPYYRKFGRCRGKDNGKCYRKHDPDQIALCTKFLQGACVDKKCPLSHNVSPEKMPTCKYYLEGSCSRDDCPYLHVRISPKADICKDFLEGFCKKATECDKRHQFLCPDYEKNGNCLKQRCPYPHGKMVRKYSVFNKNKFGKKYSQKEFKKDVEYPEKSAGKDILINKDIPISNNNNKPLKSNVNPDINTKARYYLEHNTFIHEEKYQEPSRDQKNSCIDTPNCEEENKIRSRPKLGRLPSFIAFEDI